MSGIWPTKSAPRFVILFFQQLTPLFDDVDSIGRFSFYLKTLYGQWPNYLGGQCFFANRSRQRGAPNDANLPHTRAMRPICPSTARVILSEAR